MWRDVGLGETYYSTMTLQWAQTIVLRVEKVAWISRILTSSGPEPPHSPVRTCISLMGCPRRSMADMRESASM